MPSTASSATQNTTGFTPSLQFKTPQKMSDHYGTLSAAALYDAVEEGASAVGADAAKDRAVTEESSALALVLADPARSLKHTDDFDAMLLMVRYCKRTASI